MLDYYRDLERSARSLWFATQPAVQQQTSVPQLLLARCVRASARLTLARARWQAASTAGMTLCADLCSSASRSWTRAHQIRLPRCSCPQPRLRLRSTPQRVPSAPHQACDLGAAILLETYRVHEVVRHEIVDQLFNRIISKSTGATVTLLALLARIVRLGPHLAADSIPRIREAVDYLSFLSADVARSLLQAIAPLLELHVPLRDAVMLVLRKAMFSRELESKKVAVEGLFVMLCMFKVPRA